MRCAPHPTHAGRHETPPLAAEASTLVHSTDHDRSATGEAVAFSLPNRPQRRRAGSRSRPRSPTPGPARLPCRARPMRMPGTPDSMPPASRLVTWSRAHCLRGPGSTVRVGIAEKAEKGTERHALRKRHHAAGVRRCRTRSAGWAATCGATAARATRVPCPCRRQGPRGPCGSSQYPGRKQGAEVRVAAPSFQEGMFGTGDDVGRTRIVAREAQYVLRIRRVEYDR